MRAKRLLIIMLLACLLPCGLRKAVASPVIAAENPSATASGVSGTKWSGVDSDGDSYTVWFREGGGLEYSSQPAPGTSGPEHAASNGHAFWDGSSWTQEGNTVRWQINHYSHYECTLIDGKLVGHADNPAGHRWTFTLVQDTAKAPPLEGTTWSGVDNDNATWTLTLNADGTLDYHGITSGATARGGWYSSDNDRTVEIYIDNWGHWTATVDGGQLFGVGRNKAGLKWTLTAEKKSP